MRVATLTLILASILLAQTSGAREKEVPAVITFVAPAYPRAAKDVRIQGTTLTRIAIGRDGVVTEVKTIRAHPVFEGYVVEALKQWRFKPSEQEHTLEVTCSFEFTDDKCEGTDKHPITAETRVSAELPAVVHIRTGLQCMETSNAQKPH